MIDDKLNKITFLAIILFLCEIYLGTVLLGPYTSTFYISSCLIT